MTFSKFYGNWGGGGILMKSILIFFLLCLNKNTPPPPPPPPPPPKIWGDGGVKNFAFCRLLIFFQNNFRKNKLSEIPSECQTVWILIRPYILSGLIWIKTVCKGYQQRTLVGRFNGPVQFKRRMMRIIVTTKGDNFWCLQVGEEVGGV